MSFLNILLLGGAATFLAPLIIHLLNRSRYQSVDWGAMHFLEAALQVNSRRPQWESWLLLALRCLIPILLAISLARPVLTSLRVAGASGKQSIVLLLDDSASMNAITGSETPFSLAKQLASQLVHRYRAADFALWTTGEAPSDALGGVTFDPIRVDRTLAELEVKAPGDATLTALTSGIQQFGSMSNPNKQLVLISDFQQSYWGEYSDAQLATIERQLTAGSSPTQLFFLRLPETANGATSNIQNLSVRLLQDEAWPLRVNETYRAVGQVTNHSVEDATNLRVLFRVDAIDLASRIIDVPANGTAVVNFACEFNNIGQHVIELELGKSDQLIADNRYQHRLQVVAAPRVTIVDDSLQAGMQAESSYLQLALAPFTQRADSNPFQIKVVSSEELGKATVQSGDAIVLTNIARLDDTTVDEIKNFVSNGGGLLVFGGANLDVNWYNTQLHGRHSLLPYQYGRSASEEESIPLKLASRRAQLPWLDIFNDAQAGDLSSLEFTKWQALLEESITTGSANDSLQNDLRGERTRMLSFSTGSPWLAGCKYGDGYIVQCATSCSSEGSNMPLRPVFVPLMQRLLTMLATQTSVDPIVQLANVDPRESNLKLAGEAQLETIAQKLGATVVDSVDRFAEVERLRADGREIWRWFLVTLLIALFAELLLGQKITRGSL